MTTGKKILIAVAAVLALAAIAIGIVLGLGSGNKNLYHDSIVSGNKYLAAGDYENAVKSFEKAIQIDPENEEAYQGLINVYSATGDSVMLQTVLRRAGEHNLEGKLTYPEQLLLPTDAAQTMKEDEGTLDLNDGLINMIAGYSYNDYRLRIGIASEDAAGDGSVRVRVSGVNATLILRNDDTHQNAVDTHNNHVGEKARPAEVEVDNIAYLLGKSSVTFAELQGLRLSELKLDGNTVSFKVNKCVITIDCDASGNIGPGSVAHITVPGTGADNEGTTTKLIGTVIDATTGKPVIGAEMLFRSGSSRTGSADKTETTDSSGNYTIDLPAGDYTVEIRCNGYNTEFFPIFMGAYQEVMTQNFTISPELEEGEIRIVLEWGSNPRDLDSHLTGTGAGHSVHVWYDSKYDQAAELDVDDTDGYGPETTTIHDTTGSYTFDVVDYENTGNLAASGATVKVYLPGRDVMTIRIGDARNDSSSGSNLVWHVLHIENGEVTVDNRIVNA